MPAARCDVPPVEADFVEIFRLDQGGKKDYRLIVGKRIDVFDEFGWVRDMFQRFDTGDNIEPAIRPAREVRAYWIVAFAIREARFPQLVYHHAVAAAVIQEAECFALFSEQFDQSRGVGGWPVEAILEIDQQIFLVINVFGKFFSRPVVECFGKQKAATTAATVINWHSSQRRLNSIAHLSAMAEIRDAKKVRCRFAYFARPRLRRYCMCQSYRVVHWLAPKRERDGGFQQPIVTS